MMKKVEKWFWPIVLIVTISAVAASLSIGMMQSVWFDEAYSIIVAKQPISQVVYLASVDTHPPLYYLILHWWGGLFHWDVLALRGLSVMAYGGSIIIAAVLARRLFGKTSGIWVAITLAFAPLLMRYGFEIRMYALASLVGITATYMMVAALAARGRKNILFWSIYAVLVVTGMYLLYYLAFLWIAHAIWLLFMTYRTGTLPVIHRQVWPWAYVASIIPFLPWLPTFLKQINNGALAPIGQQMNLENIVGIGTFNMLYQPIWKLDVYATIVFITAIVAICYIAKQARLRMHQNERSYIALLVLYIIVPVGVLMIVSVSKSMYVERYLSHVAIGLLSLVGVLIAIALRKPTRQIYASIALVFGGLLIGLSTLANTGNYNFQRMSKPELSAVAKQLNNCEDGEVVAADPYVYIELAAYVPSTCRLYFYNQWGKLGGGYAPLNSVVTQLRDTTIPSRSGTTYYVYYDDPKLSTANFNTIETQSFGAISVQKLSMD